MTPRSGIRGRVRMGAAMVLVVAAGLAAGAAPGAAAAAPPGQLDAPYALGMRSYTFVDTSRPTAPNGTYPGAPDRTLPTLLIYPAEGEVGGPAVEGATPLEKRAKHGFPLIVFSHGFRATGPAYRVVLLERLAREGYVVAAPTFPLSNGAAPGGPSGRDYVNQPADVSFVLDEVLGLAREDRSLRKTINTHAIAAVGHSLGAITTFGVAADSCCLDPRIDAAVPMSGVQLPFPGGSAFPAGTPPMLLIHGDADRTLPYAGSTAAYEAAPSPKALLTLERAPHTFFFSPWIDPTIRSIDDFLDGYLKHDRHALDRLLLDGNVAGVATLRADLSG